MLQQSGHDQGFLLFDPVDQVDIGPRYSYSCYVCAMEISPELELRAGFGVRQIREIAVEGNSKPSFTTIFIQL